MVSRSLDLANNFSVISQYLTDPIVCESVLTSSGPIRIKNFAHTQHNSAICKFKRKRSVFISVRLVVIHSPPSAHPIENASPSSWLPADSPSDNGLNFVHNLYWPAVEAGGPRVDKTKKDPVPFCPISPSFISF